MRTLLMLVFFRPRKRPVLPETYCKRIIDNLNSITYCPKIVFMLTHFFKYLLAALKRNCSLTIFYTSRSNLLMPALIVN